MEGNANPINPTKWLDDLIETTHQVHDMAQTFKVEIENLNRVIDGNESIWPEKVDV